MAITIKLPPDIESELRREIPDLDIAARDEFLIASYRAGRLSAGDIADILAIGTRQAAHEWLKQHGITINYTAEDLAEDRKNLDTLFGKD